MKRLKRMALSLLRLVGIGITVSALALILPRLITALYARPRQFTVQTAPVRKVAIVFGAGLYRDGRPTPVLQDRVATAAELYFAGKVDVILMSGDNRFIEYNEPEAMRRFAISLGVPAEVIILDYAGRRTYDTCYRARDIFQVEEAVLVTQGFHLPRAIYTCNMLGLPAIGVTADQRQYLKRSQAIWSIRELIATTGAFVDVHIRRPLPVLGKPEPILPVKAQ